MRDELRGAAVRDCGRGGSDLRLQALREERGDDPGEDVPGPRSRERRRAEVADDDPRSVTATIVSGPFRRTTAPNRSAAR